MAMGDVLSQQEIDSLLSGMSAGTIQVDDMLSQQLGQREVATYDFRRPSRLSKNQIRTFQNVHESLAESFAYYLVQRLQSIVSISVSSVDQLFYSEFILSVSTPSCLYVFDIEGTDGSGILEISPQLAFTMVERLLGGGTDATKKARAISSIEQAVIRGIIERLLGDLTTAWRSIGDLKFSFSRFESEADFVQIAPGSEIVLVTSFDVNIGTNSYLMNLCFPTFALEDVIAGLSRRQLTAGIKSSQERSPENELMVRKQISTTTLPVVAELGRADLMVRDIVELKEGDIIRLDTKIDQEIHMSIGGRKKLAVRPGTVDGKKAVKVIRKLHPDEIINE